VFAPGGVARGEDDLAAGARHGVLNRLRSGCVTFAGLNANFELAASWPGTTRFDNFSIALDGHHCVDSIQKWIRDRSPIDQSQFDRLPRPKFHECLPERTLTEMLRARTQDSQSVEAARSSQILYRDLE
jgi:hypothetical protein